MQLRIFIDSNIQNLPLLKATVRNKTTEIHYFPLSSPKYAIYILMAYFRVSKRE